MVVDDVVFPGFVVVVVVVVGVDVLVVVVVAVVVVVVLWMSDCSLWSELIIFDRLRMAWGTGDWWNFWILLSSETHKSRCCFAFARIRMEP